MEGGIAAGVRRIEALTGMGAVAWMQRQRAALDSMLHALNTTDTKAVEAIERLKGDARRLSRELTQLKTKLAMRGGAEASAEETIDVAGVKLARRKVSDLDKDALRGLSDSLKARIQTGVARSSRKSHRSSAAAAVDGRTSPRLAAAIRRRWTRCSPRPRALCSDCSHERPERSSGQPQAQARREDTSPFRLRHQLRHPAGFPLSSRYPECRLPASAGL
jgi:hypothetical protein